MSLLNTPYPKPKLKVYILVAAIVGFIVNFILLVFQPFGTANFDHENKIAILCGYGFCVALALITFYAISTKILRYEKWTIINEVVELFIGILFSLIACYVYSILVFNRNFSFSGLLHFIGIAASVAIIPVGAYLVFLYYNWKGFERAELSTDLSEEARDLTIIGNNKNDKIRLAANDFLLAKAQDNYVLIYTKNGVEIKKHILRTTLKVIQEQLSLEQFKKVHRSFIINSKMIESMEGNKSKAHLNIKGITKNIPVSRSAYDEIKTLTNN